MPSQGGPASERAFEDIARRIDRGGAVPISFTFSTGDSETLIDEKFAQALASYTKLLRNVANPDLAQRMKWTELYFEGDRRFPDENSYTVTRDLKGRWNS